MPRRILASILFSLFLLTITPGISAQQDDAERQRAFTLFKDGKYVEALPLFEKLAVRYPSDAEVVETLGLVIFGQTNYLKEPAARKESRKRAREILLQAQKLGARSALLKTALDAIPPDGGDDISFSTKKEVDDAMREGEQAFAKGDMPKALEMYQRALLLDPNLYEAALFIGDVYFATAEQKKASEWFARATSINPDRETAYRYWGDSLMKQGRATEAGDKFIEAYIAEPYNRLSHAAFANWAEKLNVTLSHPDVEIPTNVTPKGETNNLTITLDPNALKKDASSAAWMVYGFTRASWVQTEFAKNYPDEKKYRHSLKEEAAALRAAIRVLDEKKIKDPKAIGQSLQILTRLDKEGLLEAFILLAVPDEGIAKDFLAYRQSNVEQLRRYVKLYVVNGGVAPL
ncbi:MAG TPA: tetratricopeptide repeat protein [Pyrinomonadaceae bacterium]|nr:tetratricopeptide repeat protein [Pyrinomonadaceae bacterium]